MVFESHNAHILKQGDSQNGRVLSAWVRVEFSLRPPGAGGKTIRSHQVELVHISARSRIGARRQRQRMKRRAVKQVRRYFDGEGGTDGTVQNLFAKASDDRRNAALALDQAAALDTELRRKDENALCQRMPERPAGRDLHPCR